MRTAEGLITVGMIMLSLGLIAAVFAAILPLIAYLAGALTLLCFIFLIIGLPIFGRESNNFSNLRGDANYNKRYGFWLIVPTIILAFLASILFIAAAFLYQRFGFGNVASHAYSRRPPNGGFAMRGPANYVGGMPYGPQPAMYGAGSMMPNPYQGLAGLAGPSLLSQYIAQRLPRSYGPVVVRRTVVSALAQPSMLQVAGQPTGYVTPAYYRAPSVIQPGAYAPVINLSGQALVGPAVRSG